MTRLCCLLATFAAWSVVQVQGFSVSPVALTTSVQSSSIGIRSPFFALFSEPSDTSSDDWDFEIVDIGEDDNDNDESKSSSSSSTIPVSNLLDLLPTTAVSDVSAETRAAINEAIVQLEKFNPTPQPTVSPLLNGVWDLKYAGGYAPEGTLPSPTRQLALFLYSGGYSPGLFCLSILQKLLPGNLLEFQQMEIAISRSQPRVQASVSFSVGNGKSSGFVGTAKVVSRLETMSGVRMKETYESTSFQDMNALELPSFLQYSRDLYVTYVDEDLLIIRDATGVPEILVRQEKQFSQKWGKEPSEVDDMMPPGQSE